MNSSIIKRSIVIGGHKTSVSLEDPFWNDLKRIAHAKRVTLSELIAQIDGARKQSNLSSAIRLFVLEHFQNENKRVDVTDARRASASAEETQATRP
jgi:predicted DNA-binding ribbon-helix-helix protein